MTEERQTRTDVIGALPHRRPHRRSEKRATSSGDAKSHGGTSAPPRATGARSGRQRRSESSPNPAPQPSTPRSTHVVGTMVQAAAELAEIGLSATARAVREAVARLPRP